MHTQEKRTELLLHIRLTWAVRANVFAEWLVCYVDACMWLPLSSRTLRHFGTQSKLQVEFIHPHSQSALKLSMCAVRQWQRAHKHWSLRRC